MITDDMQHKAQANLKLLAAWPTINKILQRLLILTN